MEVLLPMAVAAVIGGELLMRISYMEDDDNDMAIPLSFDEFYSKAETGDLVLTSGIHASSVITRSFMASQWSHCGIVYKSKDGNIYEWSSHRIGENIRSCDGKIHDGPQLIPIQNLGSTVYLCKVQCNRTRMINTIGKLMSSLTTMPFIDVLSLIGCAFSTPSLDTGMGVTCAQLVALTYYSAGVLLIDRPLTNYIPDTFSPQGDAAWKCVTPSTIYIAFTSRKNKH
jgi:hypothetical protein